MRKLWRTLVPVGVAVIAALAVAAPASAYTSTAGWDQISVLKDGSPAFAAGGWSSQFPYARELFDAWDAQKAEVSTAVQASAPQINAAVQRSAGVQLDAISATVLDEDLVLSFTNGGSGQLTVNATLPTVQVYAKAAKYGLTASLTALIGPVKGSLTYDIASGTVSNVTISSLPTKITNFHVDTGILGFLVGGVVAKPIVDSIVTSVVKGTVSTKLGSLQGRLLPLLAGTFPTSFGLNNVLNQIPSNFAIGGTNVRQYLAGAVNRTLVGQPVTISIGPGSGVVGAPWFENVPEIVQTSSGTGATGGYQDVLSVKVSDYELQVLHQPEPPNDHTGLVLGIWQKCQLGLLSSATCSNAKGLSQTLQTLVTAEGMTDAQMSALQAELEANPGLWAAAGPEAAALQAELQYLQGQEGQTVNQLAALA